VKRLRRGRSTPPPRRALPGRARAWWGIRLPGYRGVRGTYGRFVPPPSVERELDDELRWLLAEPPVDDALEGELPRVAPPDVPRSFARFVEDPEPRRRVRTCTDCFLEAADAVVPVEDGGRLIHFLSDQQWVLHWLLYVGPDGGEAVVATPIAYGFESGETPATFASRGDEADVCAESFDEFLYRFWIENEIWYAQSDRHGEPRPLTDEERRYAERAAA